MCGILSPKSDFFLKLSKLDINNPIFGTRMIENICNIKWNNYGFKRYWKNFGFFLIYLLLMVI